jgi:hypothetical protein
MYPGVRGEISHLIIFSFYVYSLSFVIMVWLWPTLGAETSRRVINVCKKACWLWLEIVLDLCNTYSWLSYQKYMFLQLFGCVLYVNCTTVHATTLSARWNAVCFLWLCSLFNRTTVHVIRICDKVEYSLCPCCFIMECVRQCLFAAYFYLSSAVWLINCVMCLTDAAANFAGISPQNGLQSVSIAVRTCSSATIEADSIRPKWCSHQAASAYWDAGPIITFTCICYG